MNSLFDVAIYLKSKIKAGLYKTIDCGEVAIVPPSKITMITWASKKNNDLRGVGAYNLMKFNPPMQRFD